MALVTGNLRDIIRSRMHFKEAEIIFELNEINLMPDGGIRPTEQVIVLPDETDATFEVDLEPTTSMSNQAYYRLKVRWLGEAAALMDFAEWRIIVPPSGGSLDQLIVDANGIPGGNNGRVVWVSQTAPERPRPWMLWLQQEPGENPDPFDPLNTSNLLEWRP